MIEHTTVDGKPATVAYVDDKFNPVDKDKATLIKVRWDDGEQVILAGPAASEREQSRRSVSEPPQSKLDERPRDLKNDQDKDSDNPL